MAIKRNCPHTIAALFSAAVTSEWLLLSCYCRPQNSVQVLFPISAWRVARAAAPPSPWPLEESAMKVA